MFRNKAHINLPIWTTTATRRDLQEHNAAKCDCGHGSTWDHAGEAYSNPPDPYMVFRGERKILLSSFKVSWRQEWTEQKRLTLKCSWNRVANRLRSAMGKSPVPAIYTSYLRQTRGQKRFTISEVASLIGSWANDTTAHYVNIIARASEQMDPQYAASRHTTFPISHTRLSPHSM